MTAVLPRSVSLADIQAADRLLAGVARRTPMLASRALSEAVGGPVHLKCENLQRAGSFKIRGAYTRLARMTPEERAGGVVAASAGNHAQGVALAAQMLGCQATVFMPDGAPLPKVSATQGYGAQVRLSGATVDEALIAAIAWAADTGATFVHPFDHVDVVAGQGTVGLEIAEQCPDARTVVVCTGGGGLVAGVAVALDALLPQAKVVAAQAEGAAAWPASLSAGQPVALTSMRTMADGIAVGRPGEVPFALVRDLVDRVTLVGDEALSRAVLLMLERAKLLVEPAGAAAVAAILECPGDFEPPVVAILSGGNVDPLLLGKLLRHGLAAAGRYLSLRVTVPDLPGSLARLLDELALTGVNVLDVEHLRTDADLHLDEVEVGLQLETRGPGHCAGAVETLRAAGYAVRVPNADRGATVRRPGGEA